MYKVEYEPHPYDFQLTDTVRMLKILKDFIKSYFNY